MLKGSIYLVKYSVWLLVRTSKYCNSSSDPLSPVLVYYLRLNYFRNRNVSNIWTTMGNNSAFEGKYSSNLCSIEIMISYKIYYVIDAGFMRCYTSRLVSSYERFDRS